MALRSKLAKEHSLICNTRREICSWRWHFSYDPPAMWNVKKLTGSISQSTETRLAEEKKRKNHTKQGPLRDGREKPKPHTSSGCGGEREGYLSATKPPTFGECRLGKRGSVTPLLPLQTQPSPIFHVFQLFLSISFSIFHFSILFSLVINFLGTFRNEKSNNILMDLRRSGSMLHSRNVAWAGSIRHELVKILFFP